MNISTTATEKGEAVLTIELSHDELKPYLERAAKKMSEHMTIEGFRPGAAPFDVVKQRAGEMAIYESAADGAVRATYPKAVAQEKIHSASQPEIAVVKLAPGNPFVFTARVAVMPTVTLGDYSMITVAAKPVAVSPKDIDHALQELRKMQTKEAVVERPATKDDKVVVDLEMFLDRVPIDGGQAKSHSVVLSEPYYVPGFAEALVGVHRGETKEFELPFPKEHYQKNIAGKRVKFRVTIRDVFALALPAMDDAFAATLGQKTIADLRALLQKNMTSEEEQKERERQDGALVRELVRRSTFGDVSNILVTREAARMVDDIAARVTEQGGVFGDYLTSIKKTREQLALDVAPQAVDRIKMGVVLRALAEKESLTVSPQEVTQEEERLAALYGKHEDTQARIRSSEGQDMLRAMIQHKKVVAFLRAKAGLEAS